MRPGLKILQIQITYYYAVTFVGWVRRIAGDEYELMEGARTIVRKSGQAADWDGIATLAADGPGKKYQLGKPARSVAELHRLGNIRMARPANEAAWLEHVPKPKEWPP